MSTDQELPVYTKETLVKWADKIDGRLGPISGRDADTLAQLLRATAARVQQLQDDRDKQDRELADAIRARSGMYLMSSLKKLKDRLDARFDSHLCEMEEGYDDSITGFIEAWRIMRATFEEQLGKSPATDIKALVDRFLMWPLPKSVRSDQCVTMDYAFPRSGTNLLNADEARQMLEYLFGFNGGM